MGLALDEEGGWEAVVSSWETGGMMLGFVQETRMGGGKAYID